MEEHPPFFCYWTVYMFWNSFPLSPLLPWVPGKKLQRLCIEHPVMASRTRVYQEGNVTLIFTSVSTSICSKRYHIQPCGSPKMNFWSLKFEQCSKMDGHAFRHSIMGETDEERRISKVLLKQTWLNWKRDGEEGGGGNKYDLELDWDERKSTKIFNVATPRRKHDYFFFTYIEKQKCCVPLFSFNFMNRNNIQALQEN